jgi:hypothetical protein
VLLLSKLIEGADIEQTGWLGRERQEVRHDSRPAEQF